MQQHYQELDRALHHANTAINSLNLQSHAHTIINHLLAAYTSAMVYVSDVSTKYDALEKATIGTGAILDIVPLAQINAIITNATDRLPFGFYVRHVPEDHVEIVSTASHITIYGFFAIASTQMFDLVHVTPIPEPRDNIFLVPSITSRSIALNYNDQQYFELNEGQLAVCQLVKSGLYLCEAPVVSTMNFSSCSILNEMFNRTSLKTCEHTAIAITGVLWQKLLMPNTWLFTTDSSTLIAIICNGEREDRTILGSGIFKLDDGCVIKTPSHTIAGSYSLDMRVKQTFIKEIILSIEELTISSKVEFKDPPPVTNPTALITGPIPLELSPAADHHFVYPHIPWIFMTVTVIGLYYFNRWKKTKKQYTPPVPARRHSAPSLGERFDIMMSSLAPQHVQPHLNNEVE